MMNIYIRTTKRYHYYNADNVLNQNREAVTLL